MAKPLQPLSTRKGLSLSQEIEAGSNDRCVPLCCAVKVDDRERVSKGLDYPTLLWTVGSAQEPGTHHLSPSLDGGVMLDRVCG